MDCGLEHVIENEDFGRSEIASKVAGEKDHALGMCQRCSRAGMLRRCARCGKFFCQREVAP